MPGRIDIQPGFDPVAERNTLLSGVAQVDIPSGDTPGKVGMFDPRAFPVLVKDGAPIVAASATRSGRAVVFGHESFFRQAALANTSTARLVVNAARWVGTHRENPRVGVLRHVDLSTAALERRLGERGIQVVALDTVTADTLRDVDVLAFSPNFFDAAPGAVDAVRRFSRDGGGLLAAGLGWSHTGSIEDFVGNRVVNPVGLAFTSSTAPHAPFTRAAGAPLNTHAIHAYNELERLAPNARVRRTVYPLQQRVSEVMTMLPRGSVLRRHLAQLAKATPQFTPTEASPWNITSNPFTTLGLLYRLKGPVDVADIRPSLAATSFPGIPPASAPRVSRSLTIDTGTRGWHSTGLYAAPGQVVTIRLDSANLLGALAVQIGAHSDSIESHENWTRMPLLTRSFPLDQQVTRAANEFGGLIYIKVPKGAVRRTVAVTIENAVAAPHYTPGMTPAAWRQVRGNPAPWAEIQGERLILTVRSHLVRTLDDPSVVTAFWDRVLATQGELHPPHPDHAGAPMRAVFDRQISAGDMHAGYPIMGLLSFEADTLDVPAMRQHPERAWGMFHEIGHNHQDMQWTFDGAMEITVNLFTLWTIERVLGGDWRQTLRHPTVAGASHLELMCRYFHPRVTHEAYLAGSIGHWRADPYVGLASYIPLINHLGWGPLRRTLATYQTDNGRLSNPTDGEKWDAWMLRYSEEAKRNLAPYFQAWRLPVSEDAVRAVERNNSQSWGWNPPPATWCP